MWIHHPDFHSLVAENWNSHLEGHPQYVLAQNLKAMKQIFKVWNKTVFGDIRLKTQDAERKVLKAQIKLDAGPTDSLHQELHEAKASLHNWLQISESHRRKKSRVRWLKDGDRNTAFFHAYAKSKGVVNRIDKIFYNGNWIEDPSQIKQQWVSHFSGLAQSLHPNPGESLFDLDSSKVSLAMNLQLTKIPHAEEIRSAVLSLNADSSPGPDGFSGSFFTATWLITGGSIIKAV